MDIPTDHPTEADRPNSPIPGDPLNVPRAPEHRAAPSPVRPLKSGINTKALFIPGEDPAELDAITGRYRHDWQPVTGLECFLVDSLVRAHWLLQRLSRVEAELWIHQIKDARTSAYHKLDEDAPVGDTYSRNYERFTRLQRRIDSTERSYLPPSGIATSRPGGFLNSVRRYIRAILTGVENSERNSHVVDSQFLLAEPGILMCGSANLRQLDCCRRGSPFAEASATGGSRNGSSNR